MQMQLGWKLSVESHVQLDRKLAVELFRKMTLVRQAEQRWVELWEQGLIPGLVHSGIGHEALSVGTVAPLRHDDYLLFSHRGIGHCIAKGMQPGRIFAEFMGRLGGPSRGRGGPHLADPSLGILGFAGGRGGNTVVALGAALSAQMRGTDQVSLCFFGDGAANHGPVHEAMNAASAWKLPCIFICENNGYAMFTPQRKTSAVTDVADRARAYDMPGCVVDGNDVLAVYDAAHRAILRARSGDGPSLIEGKTYRWRGHYEGDQGSYRPQEEVDAWKQRCPVRTYREVLLSWGVLDDDEASGIEDDVRREVDVETELARASPFPAPEELDSEARS
jgi:acetoin:2,6-dichlorophenolindophenol oxidoreductase subunit alpha